jgi:hypothetical protein
VISHVTIVIYVGAGDVAVSGLENPKYAEIKMILAGIGSGHLEMQLEPGRFTEVFASCCATHSTFLE